MTGQVRVRQVAPRRMQARLTVGQRTTNTNKRLMVAEQIVSAGLSSTKVNHAHNHVQRGMSADSEEEDAERKPCNENQFWWPSGLRNRIYINHWVRWKATFSI
jgi:hypothetical protein